MTNGITFFYGEFFDTHIKRVFNEMKITADELPTADELVKMKTRFKHLYGEGNNFHTGFDTAYFIEAEEEGEFEFINGADDYYHPISECMMNLLGNFEHLKTKVEAFTGESA